MSGHSKWNNIKRKKEKTDAQRAKIFTKIGREIAVAVRSGGANPEANGKLRDLVAKAKANNIPNDNIDRIIKKAAGGDGKEEYESIVYEGYGIGGVAVIVEALTDNRNRTAGDVRHYFDKFGGNLGTSGCVSFLFEKKGVITMDSEGVNEEQLMDDCFEAGAEDYTFDQEDGVEILTDPYTLHDVREALEQKGYEMTSADVDYLPSTTVMLTDEDQRKKMNLLLEHLEDNDDVQGVWHNWENPDEEEED